jgi:putative aminopeptidase FrvX
MSTPSPAPSRAAREAMLLELTQIPTAAGAEDRVIAWIDRWIAGRSDRLEARRDDVGNILLTQRRHGSTTGLVLATAHLDHPAFIVTGVADGGMLGLEFRGGVNDPYFEGARLEVIGPGNDRALATVTALHADAKPFKRVDARLDGALPGWLTAGAIARWHFPRAEIADGMIHTDACDDLAAAAAALCALDEMLDAPGCAAFGVLLTVAEEVGFLGTIHAARTGFVPKDARLICLENSRSFPHDSPIGAGAILRVGDRISVFVPELTNRLAELFAHAAKEDPSFRWQRKLMPGGACEATAFAAYGYRSTCLCLPLGNYHNMEDIDGVAAGARPARVGREHVSVDDFHSMVQMLHVAARGLDASSAETTVQLMERLYGERAFVLRGLA